MWAGASQEGRGTRGSRRPSLLALGRSPPCTLSPFPPPLVSDCCCIGVCVPFVPTWGGWSQGVLRTLPLHVPFRVCPSLPPRAGAAATDLTFSNVASKIESSGLFELLRVQVRRAKGVKAMVALLTLSDPGSPWPVPFLPCSLFVTLFLHVACPFCDLVCFVPLLVVERVSVCVRACMCVHACALCACLLLAPPRARCKPRLWPLPATALRTHWSFSRHSSWQLRPARAFPASALTRAPPTLTCLWAHTAGVCVCVFMLVCAFSCVCECGPL